MTRDGNTDAGIEIRRIGGREEKEKCARLMAGTEPWITLGRSYEKSLSIMTDPTKEIYTALVSGEFAGFLVIDMQGSFIGYIKSLAVMPEWRNRGIGTRLLKFAEERIFQDIPNVFICVSSFNRDARRLYERLGYEVIGDLKEWVVPGHDETLLRKTLGPLIQFRKRTR